MPSTMEQRKKFRGVACIHCARPIHRRTSRLRKEISFNQAGPHPSQRLCSKMFSLRCKICGKEAPYALSYILDFENKILCRINLAFGLRTLVLE
jgi:hypothetical protein